MKPAVNHYVAATRHLDFDGGLGYGQTPHQTNHTYYTRQQEPKYVLGRS